MSPRTGNARARWVSPWKGSTLVEVSGKERVLVNSELDLQYKPTHKSVDYLRDHELVSSRV